MRIRYSLKGQTPGVFDAIEKRVTIGRADTNDIVLTNAFVADLAAALTRNENRWELSVFGKNPVKVGSQFVQPGERALVAVGDQLEIYPYSLALDKIDAASARRAGGRVELDQQLSRLILDIHRDWLGRQNLEGLTTEEKQSEAFVMTLERDLEEIARLRGFDHQQQTRLLSHCAAQAAKAYLFETVLHDHGDAELSWDEDALWRKFLTIIPDFENELERIGNRMIKSFELSGIDDISQKIERIETKFWQGWDDITPSLYPDFTSYLALRYVKKQIKDIFFGFGPLEDLIRMPNISEIMVVSRDKIYIEKAGQIENSGQEFVSDADTERIIERIVQPVNRQINQSEPLVDARLPDGSRVNAIIRPLAVSGPCLTIRKFPSKKVTIDQLIQWGALTQTAANFLDAAVETGRNILVSGGTGTGKTTLLNCLSDFIPDKDRIVTIEDTAELRLQKEHVVRLETRPANAEGKGEYSIRDLVKNALRMRPDRIVVGECRGPEALDMLQAMNTGHDGSMTTIHANSSEDVILRLEVLVQQAQQLPIESIHRQIASAIDLVVQLTRLHNGRRLVTQITEFVRYDEREKTIRTRDLFAADVTNPKTARIQPTGHLPSFMIELIEKEAIDLESFYV